MESARCGAGECRVRGTWASPQGRSGRTGSVAQVSGKGGANGGLDPSRPLPGSVLAKQDLSNLLRPLAAPLSDQLQKGRRETGGLQEVRKNPETLP